MGRCIVPLEPRYGDPNPICKNTAMKVEDARVPLCRKHIQMMADDYGFVRKEKFIELGDKLQEVWMSHQERVPKKVWRTYLIASAKYIKIGKAYDAKARLNALNSVKRGSVITPPDLGQEKLILLADIEGDMEKLLHEYFWEHHTGFGEWFHRNEQTEGALAKVPEVIEFFQNRRMEMQS